MTPRENAVPDETAEDLYEDAPCGYLSTSLDGTIAKVNRTFEDWTGRSRDDLVGRVRFQELLTPGGQIYYETHYEPLLRMQGAVRGIAVDIVRADRSRLSSLVNSVIRLDEQKQPLGIRTMVFDATDRRRYEQELVAARERERDIAQVLQRRMLSGPWPAAPGIELGVSYRPGVRTLEVGGDWYDAFWSSPSILQLVVGDVVGRGIGAATTMAQLRSATRAFVAALDGPAATLAALDEFSRRHEVGAMATVVCAELDLQAGQMRYACAGHPPPVIAHSEDEPVVLWEGRSLPLHCSTELHERTDGTVALDAGSVVLLYTDGLVEERTKTIDAGITLLAEELARGRRTPLQELTDGLLATVARQSHDDDVCLLAARLTGEA